MSTKTRARARQRTTQAAAAAPEKPAADNRECELCHLTSKDPEVIRDASEGGTLEPYYLCVNVPQCDLRVREARRLELEGETEAQPEAAATPAEDAEATS